MAKQGPNWDGLLKWSIANSDGTRPPSNLRYFFFHLFFLCLCVMLILDFDIDKHGVGIWLSVRRIEDGLWKRCKRRVLM